MTQDALHRLRLNFRLVHKPITERVTEVVKSEPLAVLNLNPSCFRGRPEIVRNKYGSGQGDAAMRLDRRKDKIFFLLVGRLVAPPS